MASTVSNVLRRLLVPVALVGALAACGGGGDDDAATPATAADAPADDTAVADQPAPTSAPDDGSGSAVVGDAPEALQFTAPLVGGGDIEMAALAGRPVLLWFWAPW